VHIDAERREFSLLSLTALEEVHPLITWLVWSPDGALWIATLTHGLIRLNPASEEASLVGETTFSAGQQIMSVAESDGSLFVGTWGGGVYFGRSSGIDVSLLGAEGGTGLRQRNVTAVMATRETGRPWIGSFGGGPQRVDVERGTAETLPGETSDLWQEGVVSLARAAEGVFFAGTTGGLWELEASGEPRRVFRHQPGVEGSLGAGYVTSLLVDSAGDLWAGVGGSGLYHLERGEELFTAYRHDPDSPTSLSGDYITSLREAAGGKLWVGTRSSGLSLCRIQQWQCRRLPVVPGSADSLNHHHITMLYHDSKDRFWVGTDGGGLHQALPGAFGEVTGFRHWGTRDGLLSDSVMAIAEDADGSLWVSTREGLTRLHPESGQASSYSGETGLPVAHFNIDSAAVDDRYLYFGAVGGLLSIPRDQPVEAQKPAPVRVTAIDSPRSAQTARAFPWRLTEYVLAYGEAFSIEFAVLDFSESLHEYEYRLAPEDPWTRLGSRHEVTFFGLAPGRHTFEVRGKDVRGLWSQAAPLELQIVPPFWMTTWFRALSLLLIASVALGVPALRLRALERRNRELTRLKNQREQALALAQESEAELKVAYEGLSQLTRRLESAKEEERQHISRELHDELGQTLTAAKIQLQLVQNGGEGGNGERTRERLDSAVEMMDEMIGQVRSISLSLRPPLLDEAGLVPALEHYLGSLANRTGVAIPLRVDAGLPDRSPAIDTTLFRVIQEAVSNALRHSGAARIGVELLAEDGSIVVLVEDDGHGFDLPEVEARVQRGEHLGLLGIRERLRAVDGRLEIESSPGGGTRLEARVPR
jgi:signal transduction histidine kinase